MLSPQLLPLQCLATANPINWTRRSPSHSITLEEEREQLSRELSRERDRRDGARGSREREDAAGERALRDVHRNSRSSLRSTVSVQRPYISMLPVCVRRGVSVSLYLPPVRIRACPPISGWVIQSEPEAGSAFFSAFICHERDIRRRLPARPRHNKRNNNAEY